MPSLAVERQVAPAELQDKEALRSRNLGQAKMPRKEARAQHPIQIKVLRLGLPAAAGQDRDLAAAWDRLGAWGNLEGPAHPAWDRLEAWGHRAEERDHPVARAEVASNQAVIVGIKGRRFYKSPRPFFL